MRAMAKQKSNSTNRRKTRQRSSLSQSKRKARKVRAASARSHHTSARDRALQVYTDMLHDPSLTFTRAAHRRKIDPRTVRKHHPTGFPKDASGRIKARGVTGKLQLLHIPWFGPGEVMPVPTQSGTERLLLGRWMTALNAAGRDDWSKMDKFPKSKTIGGVLLPTKHAEVQQILVSLADSESPFEGLYRTIARRS